MVWISPCKNLCTFFEFFCIDISIASVNTAFDVRQKASALFFVLNTNSWLIITWIDIVTISNLVIFLKGLLFSDIYLTLYTDNKGLFELNKSVFDAPTDVTIVFEDIDGDEHGGTFETAKATPDITRKEKGSGWYNGAFEVEAKVKMRKK